MDKLCLILDPTAATKCNIKVKPLIYVMPNIPVCIKHICLWSYICKLSHFFFLQWSLLPSMPPSDRVDWSSLGMLPHVATSIGRLGGGGGCLVGAAPQGRNQEKKGENKNKGMGGKKYKHKIPQTEFENSTNWVWNWKLQFFQLWEGGIPRTPPTCILHLSVFK